MPLNPDTGPLPAQSEMREACETLSGFAVPADQFTARLQFVSDLLADAGPLPAAPILLWREPGHYARHVAVGSELVIGRDSGQSGLSYPEDKLLSRRHFLLRAEANGVVLTDLKSHNGTSINRPRNRIETRLLRDGDLVLAGEHVFVFMDQGRIV